MQNPGSEILALDVGGQRIGVASANLFAMIASPLTTLIHTGDIFEQVARLVHEHNAIALVVGLPRGLDGQETAQTQTVRAFVSELQKHTSIPTHWQDEALTSRKAEAELDARKKPYVKGDIDALAATYILDDFLRDNPDPHHLPEGSRAVLAAADDSVASVQLTAAAIETAQEHAA